MGFRLSPAAMTRLAVPVLLFTSCMSFHYLDGDGEECGADGCKYPCSKVCKKPTMHALACDLDTLEKHIEKYGSVVPKVPDVWGQARLTKFRQEFDAVMAQDKDQFRFQIAGSLFRSDQAFFSEAASLGLAVQQSSRPSSPTTIVMTPSPAPPPTDPTAASNLVATSQEILTAARAPDGSFAFKKTQLAQPADPGSPPAPTPIAVPTPPAIPTTDLSDVLKRTAPSLPTALSFAGPNPGASTTAVIGLEPSEYLAQKERYLNLLNQIRRTNEGDDTADSPGYSLNLVRIPVSILPGRCTETGYGAEISFTLSPTLGDELLPVTFRNLMLNDLVKNFGLPMTLALEDSDLQKQLTDWAKKDQQTMQVESTSCANPPDAASGAASPQTVAQTVETQRTFSIRKHSQDAAARIQSAVRRIPIPATTKRRARLPFPPSEARFVYGDEYLYVVVQDTFTAFQGEINAKGFAHFPDIQSYLQEEIASAYRFLETPSNADLWAFCTPQLVEAVHAHNTDALRALRCQYEAAIGQKGLKVLTTTTALAWAVIVEAALLNEQLIQDMRETASLKGCCLSEAAHLQFFLPAPPPEARQAFNEYVRCRWPIHVFALDPANEEQNIADAFSSRREMQLALSLAFAAGNINANTLTRYARRLEADYETIALNRTQVGFSHGDDTFGWRFYPRFQTPDTESNFTVFFRDMLIGGPNRNALLRQRRLDPGERECVAIVLMPSFVPYLTCDANSNWFQLPNPKCKELDSKDAVRLSRSVKAIQTCGCNVKNADCYRDGDLPRLLRKADQLADRLPLQTLNVQVPYENTLGGFEMFNSGVTDLAPELFGWYGAPGIASDRPTTLYLVGDHYSVNQTSVLVGNAHCDPKLLSRQVMEITVPANVMARLDGQVEVHVATPYGVTNTLIVPLIKPKDKTATPEGYSLSPTTVTATYALVPASKKDLYNLCFDSLTPPNQVLQIQWSDASGSVPVQVMAEFVFSINGTEYLVPTPAPILTAPPHPDVLGTSSFVLPPPELARVLQCLVASLPKDSFSPDTDPLAKPLKTTHVYITPVGANIHATQRVESLTALTVQFTRVPARLICPPAGEKIGPPSMPPAEPANSDPNPAKPRETKPTVPPPTPVPPSGTTPLVLPGVPSNTVRPVTIQEGSPPPVKSR